MNLKETGLFIKQKRKEKGLTQEDLARKILVSEKTISKWECGNGFPDTSLILPLCQELGITANELLSAKNLNEKDYKEEAEKNLIVLQAEKERSDKLSLATEWILGIFSVIMILVPCILAAYLQFALWAKILVIIAGFILGFAGFYFCVIIETKAGYYECKHCHHKYIPKFSDVMKSMHMGRTRYMKCPKCNKKSWQKKVVK